VKRAKFHALLLDCVPVNFFNFSDEKTRLTTGRNESSLFLILGGHLALFK